MTDSEDSQPRGIKNSISFESTYSNESVTFIQKSEISTKVVQGSVSEDKNLAEKPPQFIPKVSTLKRKFERKVEKPKKSKNSKIFKKVKNDYYKSHSNMNQTNLQQSFGLQNFQFQQQALYPNAYGYQQLQPIQNLPIQNIQTYPQSNYQLNQNSFQQQHIQNVEGSANRPVPINMQKFSSMGEDSVVSQNYLVKNLNENDSYGERSERSSSVIQNSSSSKSKSKVIRCKADLQDTPLSKYSVPELKNSIRCLVDSKAKMEYNLDVRKEKIKDLEEQKKEMKEDFEAERKNWTDKYNSLQNESTKKIAKLEAELQFKSAGPCEEKYTLQVEKNDLMQQVINAKDVEISNLKKKVQELDKDSKLQPALEKVENENNELRIKMKDLLQTQRMTNWEKHTLRTHLRFWMNESKKEDASKCFYLPTKGYNIFEKRIDKESGKEIEFCVGTLEAAVQKLQPKILNPLTGNFRGVVKNQAMGTKEDQSSLIRLLSSSHTANNIGYVPPDEFLTNKMIQDRHAARKKDKK